MARPVVRDERRAQILDAMYAVIADRGLHATSITEIAEAAGIARGALHYFFASKDEITASLMRRLGERYFEQLSEGLDQRIRACAAHPERRQRLVADVARWHFLGDETDALRRFRVWIDYWAQAASRPTIRDVVVDVQEAARSLVRRALLAQRPELEQLDDEQLRAHTAAILAIIEGGLLQWTIASSTAAPLTREPLRDAITAAAAAAAAAIPVSVRQQRAADGSDASRAA